MTFWHEREELLAPGAVIEPGRWGQLVISQGQDHPFFFREQLLELYRTSHTSVKVSRLSCAFAFEDREVAAAWARDAEHYLYRVAPVDPDESGLRLDMLWLTWMGEPRSTFEMNRSRCRDYWSGRSTQEAKPQAQPSWELLFQSGLHVGAREAP